MLLWGIMFELDRIVKVLEKMIKQFPVTPMKNIIKEIESLLNVQDGESAGWQLLEGKESCCPGDDAWLGYERGVKDCLKIIKKI